MRAHWSFGLRPGSSNRSFKLRRLISLHVGIFLVVTAPLVACDPTGDADPAPTNEFGSGASGGSAAGASGGTSAGGANTAGTGAGGSSGTSGTAGTPGTHGGMSGGHGGGTGGTSSGTGCGFKGEGERLEVTANIEICLPPVVCTSETCPPPLGDCVNGKCVFKGEYEGLLTLPEAWATHYCDLPGGGCHGVSQIAFPEVTAQKVAEALGYPLCSTAFAGDEKCVGITASSPMVVGNSEVAIDPDSGSIVSNWGLGMTEASGLCYEVSGPGGTVVVAITDRCGGYCTCGGSGNQECGPCVSAPDMSPGCACVGTVPGLHSECCGRGCASVNQDCDWCASNNHPHFDVDLDAFNWVCGEDAINGSCQLSTVRFFECLAPSGQWPPGGGSCKAESFHCNGSPTAHNELVPDTRCCCNWNQCPQPDGTCGSKPAQCGAGSCACGDGMPDASHPKVPSTGCCCVFGTTPQPDGTCA